MARGVVVDLPSFPAALERNIQFAFAGIDAGTDRGRLAHLRRPFLECEPSVPSTIRVPMKCRSRSCYEAQPETAAVGNDPTDRRPGSGGRPGRGAPQRQLPD